MCIHNIMNQEYECFETTFLNVRDKQGKKQAYKLECYFICSTKFELFLYCNMSEVFRVVSSIPMGIQDCVQLYEKHCGYILFETEVTQWNS